MKYNWLVFVVRVSFKKNAWRDIFLWWYCRHIHFFPFRGAISKHYISFILSQFTTSTQPQTESEGHKYVHVFVFCTLNLCDLWAHVGTWIPCLAFPHPTPPHSRSNCKHIQNIERERWRETTTKWLYFSHLVVNSSTLLGKRFLTRILIVIMASYSLSKLEFYRSVVGHSSHRQPSNPWPLTSGYVHVDHCAC